MTAIAMMRDLSGNTGSTRSIPPRAGNKKAGQNPASLYQIDQAPSLGARRLVALVAGSQRNAEADQQDGEDQQKRTAAHLAGIVSSSRSPAYLIGSKGRCGLMRSPRARR